MLALLVRLVYNVCVSKKETKEYPMKMQVGNLVQVNPNKFHYGNGMMGIITELFPAAGEWGKTAMVFFPNGEQVEYELTDLEVK